MMRLACGALLLVAIGASDTGPPKGVTLGTDKISAMELLDGSKTISSGDFIVGVVKGQKEALLKDLTAQLNWAPKTTYQTMPMMSGHLTPVQIMWLLQRKDVTYIEADLQDSVSVAGGENGNEQANKGAKGVLLGGVMVTEQEIKDGTTKIEPQDFIVGVVASKKLDILKGMKSELSWEPTSTFSDKMPLFGGHMTKAQVVWLLDKEGVIYIEQDVQVHIMTDGDEAKGVKIDGDEAGGPKIVSGGLGFIEGGEASHSHLPKGVSIDGVMHPTKDIESGTYELHPGSYIVGVTKGKKAEVLKEMEEKYKWTPDHAYSETMPMFAGTLHQDQILGLLGMKEVKYIENDGVVHVENKTARDDDGDDDDKGSFAASLAPLFSLTASLMALAVFTP